MTDVGPPRTRSEWLQYCAIVGEAFTEHPRSDEHDDWIRSWSATTITRLARDGGRVVGGAVAIRAAEFFGGRAVPCGAVATVCVAPEVRGGGVALDVLRSLDRAMRERGLVVSPLWPSIVHLYRRAGWEVVGPEIGVTLPVSALRHMRGAGGAVREPGRAVRALRSRAARQFNGPLDLPGWWWEEDVTDDTDRRGRRYAWVQDGEVTGYLDFMAKANGGPPAFQTLEVRALWHVTGDALRGLLGVIGGHSSIAKEVHFRDAILPPVNDLLWTLPDHQVTLTTREPWMLRLVDLPAALTARGWPAGVRERVELEVHDPLHDTTDRVVLEVEDGGATVTPGGAGRVEIGRGALAAWYAGGLPATRGARLGLARGDAADLAAMDRLTNDLPAWLPDHF